MDHDTLSMVTASDVGLEGVAEGFFYAVCNLLLQNERVSELLIHNERTFYWLLIKKNERVFFLGGGGFHCDLS